MRGGKNEGIGLYFDFFSTKQMNGEKVSKAKYKLFKLFNAFNLYQ